MYLTIYFGLELEDKVLPNTIATQGGVHYHGPNGLLLLLESHLGEIGYSENTEYLRIAQYRQALQIYIKKYKKAFFKAAFEADQLATSEELLAKRDELLLAGWDFKVTTKVPDRLKALATIEAILKSDEDFNFTSGFADRFVRILAVCEKRSTPIRSILLNEPFDLLPYYWQRLFTVLQEQGTQIEQLATPIITGDTDLNILQKALNGDRQPQPLKKDGSLIILKAKRDTDAATFLAKLLQLNADFRPACLIPEKTRVLDNALIQEGLPSLGILSASLARPTLQLLKLVPVFLWRPIDPYKVLEFVTLSVKPLENDLATIIARLIAQRPGMNSEAWYAAINQYFEELETKQLTDALLDIEKIEKQYKFWFERKRYDISKSVRKEEVIEIYDYVATWASKTFETEGGHNQSLLVLSEQAKRIKELLEALPESYNFLSNLELERIVRTIYAPSPIQFKEVELNHLPYVYHPSAIIAPIEELLWWNFSQSEHPSFFSKWYHPEIDYLKTHEILLENPQRENARLIWHRKRPMLQTTGRLFLVIPERVAGSEVLAHPLLGDMEAIFGKLDPITYNIDKPYNRDILETYFKLPQQIVLEKRQLQTPSPVLQVAGANFLEKRPHETFTSLHALLYYPYQWFFRHKVRLHKSSLLSVARENTLKGNLSHRFIEVLLRENKDQISSLSRAAVDTFLEKKAGQLFAREGATLLMYGKEPERLAFLNKVKYAAWSLVKTIQDNCWKVRGTEVDLNGHFLNVPIKAKADLVLEKEGETAVLDLKWSGSNYRSRMIKNEEDLQLVLYSKLIDNDRAWSHTGYFILDKGILLARNNQAFVNCEALVDGDHIAINERILSKMHATYAWRKAQIEKGQIEIRTDQTQEELEDLYAGQLMNLLELKEGNAPFDNYRVLIGG